ncbi:MAG: RNA pseudouridine synthase [Myxococcales bacterium]|nr:RNA pseudouridine synthase [Myxococcales bacterium]MCB9520138.1 RNA pseudouridine synthase [Myxococcales bacterium]MCB9531241.1 RNA pseudouridine synthase [Myxococcales bacterium]MCB9534318.1 RNA pseudouridine synthase [Myxococcales bacterium]
MDKPAGVSTSGRSLDDPSCVQAALIAHFGRMAWAVHQLDRDTSGVNFFVTKRSLVPLWQERLRFPSAQKTYVALCHGSPAFEALRLEAPIGYVERGAFRGQAVTADGQRATTRVSVARRAADGAASAVLCTLETGRTHQIRVHLAHLGHPLFGEPWYAEPPCERHWRHALHAARVSLRESISPTGPSALRAPISSDLLELGRSLGLGDLSDLAG